MPTNRTRRTRHLKPTISDAVLRYLTTGENEEKDFDVFLLTCENDCSELQGLWQIAKDGIMADWLKKSPCTRPWAWWEFDAPRHDTGTGAYFEPLPIPRQRLGGKGQTSSQKWPAVVPRYDRAIPSSWADIDPEDPPTFESEAAYLQRHGLLSEAETHYLEKHPELMEPETVTNDE
jgi:hypothetical protein